MFVCTIKTEISNLPCTLLRCNPPLGDKSTDLVSVVGSVTESFSQERITGLAVKIVEGQALMPSSCRQHDWAYVSMERPKEHTMEDAVRWPLLVANGRFGVNCYGLTLPTTQLV
jgi:hypothetical protein